MATTDGQHPSFRPESPSSDISSAPALGACRELSRCVSTASSVSNATDCASQDSSFSSGSLSRLSSGSCPPRRSDPSASSRHSVHGHDARTRRRGYMRPQATDFAASAKSRESVMNLGSIAHLQYYFARTGLLDGKGGQLARKRSQKPNLDLSALCGGAEAHGRAGADADSTYASMAGSPDFGDPGFGCDNAADSPVENDAYDDDVAEPEQNMLPPTVSTYNHKEKTVPKPPTVLELKAELESTLNDAAKSLQQVRDGRGGASREDAGAPELPNMPEENTQSWYELQGMHILDLITLAIRAAKMYYTAHELPDRLDSIKSEKQVRADLLAVMETLKQMATRGFRGGMRDEEIKVMADWIESVLDILKKDQEIEDAENRERTGWLWLDGDWTGREREREREFLASMDPDADPLPEWTAASEAESLPTPFLRAMQNGLRLVKLHNAAVKKSRRRFGAIPTFHSDTQKPYRCADNLRYWIKAAELRFEVMLTVDVMGVVYDYDSKVWEGFEAAILQWCRHVREEITRELR